jgi:cysteinyl-tRNA synthetase
MLIRFYLLSTHYRSPINFSDADLENAKGGLERLINVLSIVREHASCGKEPASDKEIKAIKESFVRAMDKDFNTAEALGSAFKLCDLIFELNNENNVSPKIWAQATSLFEEIVVDVLGLNVQINELPEDIQALASEIRSARAKKDYKKSDEIRAELLNKGYSVEITKSNEIKVRKGV